MTTRPPAKDGPTTPATDRGAPASTIATPQAWAVPLTRLDQVATCDPARAVEMTMRERRALMARADWHFLVNRELHEVTT